MALRNAVLLEQHVVNQEPHAACSKFRRCHAPLNYYVINYVIELICLKMINIYINIY